METQEIVIFTVSGLNTIGIYITPLVLIQPTDVEQNAVNNNWLLKLQLAVISTTSCCLQHSVQHQWVRSIPVE